MQGRVQRNKAGPARLYDYVITNLITEVTTAPGKDAQCLLYAVSSGGLGRALRKAESRGSNRMSRNQGLRKTFGYALLCLSTMVELPCPLNPET